MCAREVRAYRARKRTIWALHAARGRAVNYQFTSKRIQ